MAKTGAVGTVLHQGSRDWYPEKKYDLIWTQWCVGHLMDSQLIDYTVRCRNALTENGLMVVKENLSTHNLGHDMYDDEDSSVTRTDAKISADFPGCWDDHYQFGFCKRVKLPQEFESPPCSVLCSATNHYGLANWLFFLALARFLVSRQCTGGTERHQELNCLDYVDGSAMAGPLTKCLSL